MPLIPAPKSAYRHTVAGHTYDCMHRFRIDGTLIAIEVNAVYNSSDKQVMPTEVNRHDLSFHLGVAPQLIFFACGRL